MPLEWSQPLTLTLLVNCAALPAILDVSLHPSMEGHYFIENHYLHQLRKAAGGVRGMHAPQAGALVEHLGSSNGRRCVRKPLDRFLHVFGAAPGGLPV